MEELTLKIGEKAFDELVHGEPGCDPPLAQCDGAGLTIAAKNGCLASGAPGVALSFYCVLRDGTVERVQAVTTLRAFIMAAQALAVHPDLQ